MENLKIKVLYETCCVGEKYMDLRKENEESLISFFKFNGICAYLNVKSNIKSKYFKKIGDNMIFLPAFSVTEAKDSVYYFLKAIANIENFVYLDHQYLGFNEEGKLNYLISDNKIPFYHMEGIFGFKINKNGTCQIIEKAIVKNINSYDNTMFDIEYNEEMKAVVLFQSLPKRYPADNFFDKVIQLGSLIKPLNLKVKVPLSSSVFKEVR